MKEVLYVGSSFHLERTGSTVFLVDLLETRYTVSFLRTDDPRVMPDPTKEYDVAVYFQSIPWNWVPQIRARQKVFFPMFDQARGERLEVWHRCRDFQVVCFSRALHRKLSRLGLSCLAVQYFPQPVEAPDPEPGSLFFWQRRPEIHWGTVRQLFPRLPSRMHWHLAMDWGDPTPLSPEELGATSLTTSHWFASKAEYHALLGEFEFYLAPRLAEGIGFSFLEAMARNRIVIAHNASTMNEYIQHGKTGFLFRLNRILPVSLKQLDALRTNLRGYMNAGYERWLVDQQRLLDFMESPPRPHVILLIWTGLRVVLVRGLRSLKRTILSLVGR